MRFKIKHEGQGFGAAPNHLGLGVEALGAGFSVHGLGRRLYQLTFTGTSAKHEGSGSHLPAASISPKFKSTSGLETITRYILPLHSQTRSGHPANSKYCESSLRNSAYLNAGTLNQKSRCQNSKEQLQMQKRYKTLKEPLRSLPHSKSLQNGKKKTCGRVSISPSSGRVLCKPRLWQSLGWGKPRNQ